MANIGGLARRLIADKFINEAQALAAIQYSSEKCVPLVSHLVSSQMIDSRCVAISASEEFGVPLLDLDSFDSDQIPMNLVDAKLIKKHNVLPLFKRAKVLYLAVSDPAINDALSEIKFHTGMSNDLIIVEEDKLAIGIQRYLKAHDLIEDEMPILDDVGLGEFEIELVKTDIIADDEPAADEAPIVKFVNKILLDAVRGGSSDIHIEPYEKIYRVRVRTDGVLHEIARPPISIAGRIASRIKIMSQMDISERRMPQDGRIKMKISKTRAIDLRVNTLPTLWGEKIVLRILDPTSAQMGIDALGYEQQQKQLYLQALTQHQGLILVTGPTGSGKTVSLYTGLNILNTEQRNISTAEDPVEINLEGINQVAVSTKVGLDFATALRAFLRQDPDVVMVGEIRDLETAEIAIKASQTGHLVMSTLHTNSAPETLTRLRNMGIPAFNLATSVSLIIAQRLARRLCKHCKERFTLPEKNLLEAGFAQQQLACIDLHRPKGCDQCNAGYKGRVGIYEVLPITDSIARLIMADGNSIQIADKAKTEGFAGLRQSALQKVAQGVTSLEEANRVT